METKEHQVVSNLSELVSRLVSPTSAIRFRLVSELVSNRFPFPLLWRETGNEFLQVRLLQGWARSFCNMVCSVGTTSRPPRRRWRPEACRGAIAPREYEQRQRDRTDARLSRRFVMGPIPVPWLARAFSLTSSAAKCALALFYQRGLCRSDEFKVEPARFRELGIHELARRRGLLELEIAGLIRLRKRTSKPPITELIGLKEINVEERHE